MGYLAAIEQDKQQLTRDAVDAFNRRDLDRFLALAHEDVEIHSRIVAMEGGYGGHDGARRWWQNLLEFIPDYALEVGEIEDFGDGVLVELHASGHGAVSEAPLEETVWQSAVWRDGRCAWWQISQTRDEALAALSARG